MENLLFSVIICTFNRANLLKHCIDSLVNQSLSSDQFEIIVIDNNSSDETKSTVDSYKQYGVRYIFEKEPGLSNARNRGIIESKGYYLAYIDDDAKADKSWLEIAKREIHTSTNDIDCLGGPYYPFYTTIKPNWFKDEYEVRGFGDERRELSYLEYLSGANMIWSRKSINIIGGFEKDLGVTEGYLKLGEETFAFDKLRMLNKDAKIIYVPDLIIFHWVPPYKMRIIYNLKRRFASGQYLSGIHESDGIIASLFFTSSKIIVTFKSVIGSLLFKKTHKNLHNIIFEEGGKIFFILGLISGLMGIKLKINNR